MLYRNCIASTIVTSLLLVSFFFLVHITISESQHIASTSKPRLTCFLIVHLYIIVMMVAFLMIQQTYGMVKWAFWLCLVVAGAMTGIELGIYVNRAWNSEKLEIKTTLPLEMAYVNCYFLTYMYALIGLFISSMFLLLTKIGIYVQQRRILHAIQQCIYPIKYDHVAMHDLECSVCLSLLKDNNEDNNQERQDKSNGEHGDGNRMRARSRESEDNQQQTQTQKIELLEMKCKHIFHYQCLMEWIRINQSCPTCRFNVFEAIEDDEDVNVHVIRNQ